MYIQNSNLIIFRRSSILRKASCFISEEKIDQVVFSLLQRQAVGAVRVQPGEEKAAGGPHCSYLSLKGSL